MHSKADLQITLSDISIFSTVRQRYILFRYPITYFNQQTPTLKWRFKRFNSAYLLKLKANYNIIYKTYINIFLYFKNYTNFNSFFII